MRKCPGCGVLVSPNSPSCPSCKRGLRVWHVRTLTGACRVCQVPILLHTAFERHEQAATGYSVTVIGNSAEVSSTGGAIWVSERPCPKCGEPRPLKHTFRPWWRSWAFWLGLAWPTVAFMMVTKAGGRGPNMATIMRNFFWIYSVPIGLPILLYWRRRRRVNSLLRRAFRTHPKHLELKGYDLFAMCSFIRRCIKNEEAISVNLSVEEATLPAKV